MPELPEVETIKRGIEIINNLQIKQVFRSEKKLRIDSMYDFSLLKEQKINKIKRRARYIICELSNDKSLIIHLGMTGRLTIGNFKKKPHDHFACQFSNDKWLIFNDARRFGFIDLIDNDKLQSHQFLHKLGPEPLSNEFNTEYLLTKIKNKKMNIKTILMDNSLVVGVGNIYANESLFDCQISPQKPAYQLTKKQANNIVKSVKKIIQQAINLGGSSISDYVSATEEYGNFQNNFKVYGRHDRDCLKCKEVIARIIQNGRSTFFCPKCQK
jgi:formamidopyrimidine-DNA glycosylase